MKLIKCKREGVVLDTPSKRGFTLLELLAVIILLAVIALITVPLIMSTMKDARKSSFKTSMVNLVKAADNYYADNQLDITSSIAFDFLKGGVNEKGEELSFKGTKPQTGRVVINADGEISLLDVSDGAYYANYNSNSDDDVLVTDDNEVLTRDELTERLKKLEQELVTTKTELGKKANQTELDKKANQTDVAKMNTQLTSTTTIANTANNTANSLNTSMLNKTYPVGSIYISYSATNPGSLFGGTWVAYGAGRTLVGMDTSQTEFNTIGKAGGAKTHTLTLAQIPNVTGSLSIHGGENSSDLYQASGAFYAIATVPRYGNVGPGMTGANSIRSLGFNLGGGGQAHNNLQPYITVYMFRRTA